MTKFIVLKETDPKFWGSLQMPDGEDGCWLHKIVAKNRYGKVMRNYVHYRTHRYAYILAKGRIPGTMQVHHSCDNPACCNPAHLWAGTQKENMQDKVRKGRANVGDKRGDKCKVNKLTLEDVHAIRRRYALKEKITKIHKDYPFVKYNSVYNAAKNITWRGL